MAEMDITVRVVIRDKGRNRMEYSRKITDKELTDNAGFWSQAADMQIRQATKIVTTAVANEHGGPHA